MITIGKIITMNRNFLKTKNIKYKVVKSNDDIRRNRKNITGIIVPNCLKNS